MIDYRTVNDFLKTNEDFFIEKVLGRKINNNCGVFLKLIEKLEKKSEKEQDKIKIYFSICCVERERIRYEEFFSCILEVVNEEGKISFSYKNKSLKKTKLEEIYNM